MHNQSLSPLLSIHIQQGLLVSRIRWPTLRERDTVPLSTEMHRKSGIYNADHGGPCHGISHTRGSS